MKTVQDLVMLAKQHLREIELEDADRAIREADVLIDVREAEEFNAGHIPSAINIPRGLLEFKISSDPELEKRDLKIVLYCQTSGRAALSGSALKEMGYLQVMSIAGGFDAWSAKGKAIDLPQCPASRQPRRAKDRISGRLRRKFVRRLLKKYGQLRAFTYRVFFSDNKPNLNNTKIVQPTQFVGDGRIKINKARLGFFPSPGFLNRSGYIEARTGNAIVEISESTTINNGFTIIADKSSIHIGKRCLIGPDFFVTDSDFHGMRVEDRTNGNYDCKPVRIDDDVFIGHGVKVMKGVHIGQGAVIGSGSIVITNIEAFSINAGVPARKIRNLPTEQDSQMDDAFTQQH